MNSLNNNRHEEKSQQLSTTIYSSYLNWARFNDLQQRVEGYECAYFLWMLNLSCQSSRLKKKGIKYIARTYEMLMTENLLSRNKVIAYLKRLKDLGRIEVHNTYYKNHKMTHIRVLDCPEFYLDHMAVKKAAYQLGSIEKALQYFSLDNLYHISSGDEFQIDGIKHFTDSKERFGMMWGVSVRNVDSILQTFIEEKLLIRKKGKWAKHSQYYYSIPESAIDCFKAVTPNDKSYPQPKFQNCRSSPANSGRSYKNILSNKENKNKQAAPSSFANAKIGSGWEWREWNTQRLIEELQKHQDKIPDLKQQFTVSKFSILKRMKEKGAAFNHALNIEIKIIWTRKDSKPLSTEENKDKLIPAAPSVFKRLAEEFKQQEKEKVHVSQILNQSVEPGQKPKGKKAQLMDRIEDYRKKIDTDEDPGRKAFYRVMVGKLQEQISNLGY